MSKKQTQCARILELLSTKAEVSAWELSSISLQYAARVCELRRMGATIANRLEVKADGTRHGFYKLVRRAMFPEKQHTPHASATTVPSAPEPKPDHNLLFPETYRYPD